MKYDSCDIFLQVDSCRITLNKETSKLIIQNICQHETVKTHYISVLEPGMLHANYSTDNVPNVLVIPIQSNF